MGNINWSDPNGTPERPDSAATPRSDASDEAPPSLRPARSPAGSSPSSPPPDSPTSPEPASASNQWQSHPSGAPTSPSPSGQSSPPSQQDGPPSLRPPSGSGGSPTSGAGADKAKGPAAGALGGNAAKQKLPINVDAGLHAAKQAQRQAAAGDSKKAAQTVAAEAGTQAAAAAAKYYKVPLAEELLRTKAGQKLMHLVTDRVANQTRRQVIVISTAAKFGVLFMLLFGLVGVSALVASNARGQAYLWDTPTETAAQTIPAGYLAAYEQAGREHNVPWTVIAAIGALSSAHGQVNPYEQPVPAPQGAAPVTVAGAPASFQSVYLVGDSLAVGMSGPLEKALAPLPVKTNAKVSMQVSWGVDQVKAAPPKSGDVVVVVFGANHGTDSWGVDAFAKQVDELMREIPQTVPVRWLTVHMDNWEPINKEIRAATTRWPNLQVIDWERHATSNDVRRVDNAHYADYTPMAAFVTGQLRSPQASPASLATPGAAVPVSVTDPDKLMEVPAGACPPLPRPIAGEPGQGEGPLMLVRDRLDEAGLVGVNTQDVCQSADAVAQRLAQVADELTAATDIDLASLVYAAKDGDLQAAQAVQQFWGAVVARIGIVGSPAENLCELTPIGAADKRDWVTSTIKRQWQCRLADVDLKRAVTAIDVDGGFQYPVLEDVEAARDQSVDEALQVAAAWSDFGERACGDDADVAGVFPLTKQQFNQFAPDELKDLGRCDAGANIAAAAELFAAGETVDPSDRPAADGPYMPLAGGWAAFTPTLGDDDARKAFATNGPVWTRPLPEECSQLAATLFAAASQSAENPFAGMDAQRLEAAQAMPLERPVEIAARQLNETVVAGLRAADVCQVGGSVPDVTLYRLLARFGPNLEATDSASARPLAETALGAVARRQVETLENGQTVQPGSTALLPRLSTQPLTVPPVGSTELGFERQDQWAANVLSVANQFGGLYEGDPVALAAGGFGIGNGRANVGPPVPYFDLINAAAARYDLDPRLLAAFLRQESDFRPTLNCDSGSRSLAWGIAQFMPATWETKGVDGNGDGQANICDVEDAIPAAAKYFKELYDGVAKEAPGADEVTLTRGALAAYNAGGTPGILFVTKGLAAMQNYLRTCSSSWCGESKVSETTNYISQDPGVRSVMNFWEEYKRQFPAVSAMGFGQVQVGPNGCPTNVPSGTLRNGAESVGGYELCAKSVAQAATPEAAKAIQWAFSKLGTPYACMGMANQYSARLGPNYYDCSSLVASSYRHGAGLPGVNPGQSTRNIIPWDGVPMEPYYLEVPPSQARPGDLVGQMSCTSPPCPYQHVVMLLADGYQLHTNSCGDVAHVTRFAGFEASNFAGVRRVDPNRAR